MYEKNKKLRVLIIGGYGEFGGRLAQLLLRDSHDVLVAGRSIDKAQKYCNQYGGHPVQLDITSELSNIATMGVDVVVDAAGPFQTYGSQSDAYRVAKFSLECGAHYLDLADDGNFIAGIESLEALAKQQKRFALSGASSTPAISGAAISALKKDFVTIEKLETTILPGSRAPQGYSVMHAILAQVGNAVPFWRNGGWVNCAGWSEPVDKSVNVSIKRSANLIATADTLLFPKHFQARSVLFRAGLAVPLMHKALQFLGALRYCGFLPNLTRFIRPLRIAANCITPFGNNSGGMLVEVIGTSDRRDGKSFQHSTWSLHAEPNQGPYVPAIPIRALLQNIDKISPGARACIDELSLPHYESAMNDIGVHTKFDTQAFRCLFSTILENQWPSIPQEIRDSHTFVDRTELRGEASIRRGTSWMTELVAAVFRFPKAVSNTPVQVTKTRIGDREIWVRDFNGQRFQSILSRVPVGSIGCEERTSTAIIQEQFGLMKFTLQLPIIDSAIHMNVLKGSCLNIPIPKVLLPISNTQEYSKNETFHFSVQLRAPFNLGLIVHYEGWLKPVAPEPRLASNNQ